MSGWGKIEEVTAELIKTGLHDMAAWAVHKLRGDATDDTAKEMIAKIVKRALDDARRGFEEELGEQADRFGLAMAMLELGPLTEDVLDAFEVKDGKSFGALPAEEMPADWHPPKDDDDPEGK